MGNCKNLFGGDAAWKADDWTASDDRVRGGKSQSYLECSSSQARFYGDLDIDTLGGAGFASQRTTGKDREWDLSDYDGIELVISRSDSKRYTFILKDEILDKDPKTGREQSTVSYEYDFELSADEVRESDDAILFIPWADLKATYRGREKKDAPSLDTTRVKRLSLMMRSFFGDQKGPFSLTVKSISAAAKPDDQSATLRYSEKGHWDLEQGGPPKGPDSSDRMSQTSAWKRVIAIAAAVSIFATYSHLKSG